MNGLEVRNSDVIGSGSVAQVYRGSIHDPVTNSHKSVAVKILHPNIEEKMERDIIMMTRIANVIGTHLGKDTPFTFAPSSYKHLLNLKILCLLKLPKC